MEPERRGLTWINFWLPRLLGSSALLMISTWLLHLQCLVVWCHRALCTCPITTPACLCLRDSVATPAFLGNPGQPPVFRSEPWLLTCVGTTPCAVKGKRLLGILLRDRDDLANFCQPHSGSEPTWCPVGFQRGWSWPVARDEGLTQKGSFVNLHLQEATGPCQGLGSKYGGKYDSHASSLPLPPHICLLRSTVKYNQVRIRKPVHGHRHCRGPGSSGVQGRQGEG